MQDLSFGLIDSLEIRPIIQQKQWSNLEAIAAELATDDLTRLIDGLCLTNEYAQALTHYRQSGKSALHHLLVGVHDTFLAWQARGASYAKYLANKQIEDFAQHLGSAFEHLNRSFSHRSFEIEAAARTVRVAMGLSEPEIAKTAFYKCLQMVPDHLQAHLFFFNVLTPKWFGDEDALENFVDAAHTPALRNLLQAMYLVEMNNEVADSAAIVKQKFSNDNIRRFEQVTQLKPLANKTLYATYLNNYLAGVHHVLDQPNTRNTFLRVLGPNVDAYPWMYFGLGWQDVQKLVTTT